MNIMNIPISELAIAKTNVRYSRKKSDYSDLIPSVREKGILQFQLQTAQSDTVGAAA